MCVVVSPPAHHAAVDRTPDQTVQQQPGCVRGLTSTLLQFCHFLIIISGTNNNLILSVYLFKSVNLIQDIDNIETLHGNVFINTVSL